MALLLVAAVAFAQINNEPSQPVVDTQALQAQLTKVKKSRAVTERGYVRESRRLAKLYHGKPLVVKFKPETRAITANLESEIARQNRILTWERKAYANALRISHIRVKRYLASDQRLYDIWHEQGVKPMVDVAMQRAGLSPYIQQCFHNIITRESHYNPSAKNPKSTASGILQFLDHWGPSYLRFDPVWSIKRGIRQYQETGSLSPWAPVPC